MLKFVVNHMINDICQLFRQLRHEIVYHNVDMLFFKGGRHGNILSISGSFAMTKDIRIWLGMFCIDWAIEIAK